MSTPRSPMLTSNSLRKTCRARHRRVLTAPRLSASLRDVGDRICANVPQKDRLSQVWRGAVEDIGDYNPSRAYCQTAGRSTTELHERPDWSQRLLAGLPPERAAQALAGEKRWIERFELMAERLRWTALVADRAMHNRQRVVAAVRVLHEHVEKARPRA